MRKTRSCIQGGIVLGILASAPSTFAAVYEVGPGKAHKDLGAVASSLQPGDIVEIQGNATYPGNVRLTRSGTPSNKITIRGIRVNGKRPVLSGGTNTLEIQANHYVVEGLDITQGSTRCYFHHGHDITIRDTVIHDCPLHGILGATEDSGSLTLEYSEIYRCGEGERRHAIYMATDELRHPGAVFRMQHNYLHSSTGGHSVKSRAERNEIYYNWIEGALYHELELIGPDEQEAKLKREDSDVVGNVLRKTNDFWVVRFGGDGTGDTNGRYRFVNNTVILQSESAGVFRLFDGIESLEAHNNVLYAPAGSSFRVLEDGSAIWATGNAVIAGSNNWVLSSASQTPSQWSGTISGTHPDFASLGSFDLTPTASSPLVDAGAANPSGPAGYPFPNPLPAPKYSPPSAAGVARARPVSGRIDIGAFEYAAPGSAGGPGASERPHPGPVGEPPAGGAPTAEAPGDDDGDGGGASCRMTSSGAGGGAAAAWALMAAVVLAARRSARG